MAKNKKERNWDEITLPEDVKESYRFSYKLSYDEAYEAFTALAFKRSKTFQISAGIALTAAAVFLLVSFALDNTKVMNLFLALIDVLLLFYLIYFPVLKARKGARSVAKADGIYKIEITDTGTIRLPNAEPIDLDGDKDARAVETDTIFVIRPDTGHTFCIPKRVMNEKEVYGVREILKAYIKVQ